MNSAQVHRPNRLPQGSRHAFTGMENRFPLELLSNVLLELYTRCCEYDVQSKEGKIMRRTLAACCLVCRRWHKIITAIKSETTLPRYDAVAHIQPLPHRTPLSTPPSRLETGLLRRVNPEWLPQNYTITLSNSHPKFLLELLPNMIQGVYEQGWRQVLASRTSVGDMEEMQSTLAACCLVCHEWNRICTPILYGDIILPIYKEGPGISQSLLHRTLDRKSTRLNSSHSGESRMPSSA